MFDLIQFLLVSLIVIVLSIFFLGMLIGPIVAILIILGVFMLVKNTLFPSKSKDDEDKDN